MCRVPDTEEGASRGGGLSAASSLATLPLAPFAPCSPSSSLPSLFSFPLLFSIPLCPDTSLFSFADVSEEVIPHNTEPPTAEAQARREEERKAAVERVKAMAGRRGAVEKKVEVKAAEKVTEKVEVGAGR